MKYLIKYLTMAPVLATVTVVLVSTVFIGLNYRFPGLQYGTYFHNMP